MTTATLNPTQTKREKVNLSQVIGGTFESVTESFLGIPPSYEAKEAIRTPVPEYVRREFSSGSIEGFNQPQPKSTESDERLIEAKRAYLRNYNIVTEATQVVKNYESKQEVEDQVRLEMAGMSDEERAVEGNYQANYRGVSLKKIYNTMWIFFKKVATKLAGEKEQTAISIAETRNKGKSSKFEVGENDLLMGGEKRGGHWTQAPG